MRPADTGASLTLGGSGQNGVSFPTQHRWHMYDLAGHPKGACRVWAGLVGPGLDWLLSLLSTAWIRIGLRQSMLAAR